MVLDTIAVVICGFALAATAAYIDRCSFGEEKRREQQLDPRLLPYARPPCGHVRVECQGHSAKRRPPILRTPQRLKNWSSLDHCRVPKRRSPMWTPIHVYLHRVMRINPRPPPHPPDRGKLGSASNINIRAWGELDEGQERRRAEEKRDAWNQDLQLQPMLLSLLQLECTSSGTGPPDYTAAMARPHANRKKQRPICAPAAFYRPPPPNILVANTNESPTETPGCARVLVHVSQIRPPNPLACGCTHPINTYHKVLAFRSCFANGWGCAPQLPRLLRLQAHLVLTFHKSGAALPIPIP